MPVLSVKQPFDVPKAGIAGRDLQRTIDLLDGKGCLGAIERGNGPVERSRWIDGRCGDGAHALPANVAPLLPMTAATVRRSPWLRAGAQRSMIRTTRSSSLSFHASCSIVSSKTKASPTFHSRV